MILHLVSDHYYTNIGLRIFEEKLPGQNIILVIGKHFGYIINNGISVTDENVSDIVQKIDFSKIDYVIVSYLSRKKMNFIRKYIPQNIPLIWWTYGNDLYANFLRIRGFKVFYSDPDKYSFCGKWGLPFFKILRYCANYYFRYQDKYVINRLVGFVPCIYPEYSLLRRYTNKDFNLIRIHSYGASYKFDGQYTNGKDIALGHSASISDNHLYALNYLKKLDLGDAELYLTLSYSNRIPRYTEEVRRKFRNAYGEKVRFIESMVPKNEYFESQFRYKAMILPSWRQEALDNIYTCLQIGIKLILSERSIVFQYLKEYGFIVFAIEKMDQECLDNPLTLDEKRHNQQLFVKFVEERKRNYYSDFDKYFKNTKVADEQ